MKNIFSSRHSNSDSNDIQNKWECFILLSLLTPQFVVFFPFLREKRISHDEEIWCVLCANNKLPSKYFESIFDECIKCANIFLSKFILWEKLGKNFPFFFFIRSIRSCLLLVLTFYVKQIFLQSFFFPTRKI